MSTTTDNPSMCEGRSAVAPPDEKEAEAQVRYKVFLGQLSVAFSLGSPAEEQRFKEDLTEKIKGSSDARQAHLRLGILSTISQLARKSQSGSMVSVESVVDATGELYERSCGHMGPNAANVRSILLDMERGGLVHLVGSSVRLSSYSQDLLLKIQAQSELAEKA